MVGKLFHWVNHLLGNNTGDVISWSDDTYIYVGFKCSGCGKVDESSIDKIEQSVIMSDMINNKESDNNNGK